MVLIHSEWSQNPEITGENLEKSLTFSVRYLCGLKTKTKKSKQTKTHKPKANISSTRTKLVHCGHSGTWFGAKRSDFQLRFWIVRLLFGPLCKHSSIGKEKGGLFCCWLTVTWFFVCWWGWEKLSSKLLVCKIFLPRAKGKHCSIANHSFLTRSKRSKPAYRHVQLTKQTKSSTRVLVFSFKRLDRLFSLSSKTNNLEQQQKKHNKPIYAFNEKINTQNKSLNA